MVKRLQNRGFSLAEVMMAAGILAIGFVFIAGVFPVGVKLTAIATEQTIAPIVADEAIAKVRLYGDPNFLQVMSPTEYRNFSDIARWRWSVIPPDEFTYPSADISPELKKYNWSALCRGDMFSNDVHVIVFVSRKAGAGARYLTHESQYTSILTNYGQEVAGVLGDWPVPVKVRINVLGPKRLETVASGEAPFFNAGCTIVDDLDGSVYRVLKRTSAGVIRLDREWRNGVVPSGDFVWVVPPAVGSSRYPGIGIYQRVVSF